MKGKKIVHAKIAKIEAEKKDVYSRIAPIIGKNYVKIMVEAPDGGMAMPIFISNEELLIISARSNRSKEDFGESDLPKTI